MAADPTKQRIITHMNTDHSDCLTHYLRHYAGLSLASTHNAQLVDLSLSSLTISASGTTHTIPLSPPLKSFSEARQRLIEMDIASKHALGIKTPLVRKFTWPSKPAHKIVGGLVLFYLVSYAVRNKVVPGSVPYGVLEKVWPMGGAEGYLRVQEKIVKPLIYIHAVETAVMAVRLFRAGVSPLSGVWWKWIAACTIEGVGSHERLGKEIKENSVKL